MTMIQLYTGQEWSISKKTKHNLDILCYDLAKSNMDIVIIVDGYEGSGKSFMARGIGRYVATILRKYYPNTKFDVDDITFDTTEYINSSLRHGSPEEKKAVKINVLDEGRHALNRLSSMSKGNKHFTNFLSECRAMRQVHMILCPAFHDLDKNVVLWRTSAIFHAIKGYETNEKSDSGYSLKRGGFKLFTKRSQIATKYCFPYQYPETFEDFANWSSKDVFTDEEVKAYDEKKFNATIKKYQMEEEKIDEEAQFYSEMIRNGIVAKKLGIKTYTLTRMVDRGELKGQKISNKYYLEKADVQRKFGIKLD